MHIGHDCNTIRNVTGYTLRTLACQLYLVHSHSSQMGSWRPSMMRQVHPTHSMRTCQQAPNQRLRSFSEATTQVMLIQESDMKMALSQKQRHQTFL